MYICIIYILISVTLYCYTFIHITYFTTYARIFILYTYTYYIRICIVSIVTSWDSLLDALEATPDIREWVLQRYA